MNNNTVITIRAPILLKRQFEDYCLEHDTDMSSVGRNLIENLLTNRRKVPAVEEVKKKLQQHKESAEKEERRLRALLTAAQAENEQRMKQLEEAARNRQESELEDNKCEGCGALRYAQSEKVTDFKICVDCYSQGRHLRLAAQKLTKTIEVDA